MSTPTDDLPDLCFALIACYPAGQRIVAIKNGEGGYYTTDLDEEHYSVEQARAVVDKWNESLGVNEEQKTAMVLRSMNVWGAGHASRGRVLH